MKYAVLLLVSFATSALAYESLQGPTEVLYWDKANTCDGYTWFGVRGTTYLVDMEGRVVHTWRVGTNPHLLPNGNVLDAAKDDPSGFGGFTELNWDGSNVWSYTETRTNYFPHHDFLRIFNPKLGTNTTLYIANKTVTSNQCIAAGCDPANARNYTNAQMDAIVEVDMSSNIVWEWWFYDHLVQSFDATKSNYVTSVSNHPSRLNANIPGLPVQRDWLHCNSIDYNTNLDQIVINAAGGEFYVIDHGTTFVTNSPAASIALAASTNGDFLYRFGDPARYGQGSAPSIQANWATSTTGNKQIGASSHAQWIPTGRPGAGHFLVFNNGGDLFETTPQSYICEINATNDTGAYVNPPAAGYTNWAAPGHDTDKRTKSMSRQITWMYYSMANQGMFSHLDSGVQRLPNGNTLVCDSTEGHIFEVTAAGTAVWEYVNPVSADGITAYKRDNWPMRNAVYRAYRYPASHPALTNRTLLPQGTITGEQPSYIAAPAISGTALNPSVPTAADAAWVTAIITNSRSVASATLLYIVGSTTNFVTMLDDGLHQDGAAGDGVYGGQIPAFPAGTNVSYYISAQDEFSLTATDPAAAPGSRYSYVVSEVPPTTVQYDLMLGRPTDQSIAVSVLSSNDLIAYLEWGTQPGVYAGQTTTTAISAVTPAVLTLAPLLADQHYYYRLRYHTPGDTVFSAGAERSFRTQRVRGSTFTFDIEADPHHLDNDPAVWRVALTNMLADSPDFLIDLGDTFMDEKLGTNTYAGAAELCRDVRTGFFSILGHSVPLFLVNGNHDPELGWLLDNASPQDNIAVWGAQARDFYYPCPVSGAFYSGSTNTDPYMLSPRDSYYSFEWGNALFIVLDPFWNTCQATAKSKDPWSWTLGTNQYEWLRQTLAQSTATFKFVFIHHLVGGSFDGVARGGVELAPYFEWGGYNTNGTWGFATNRPGWTMPIQSLLLSNGVNAVFHGHDHLYVKQDLDANGDGITDLVYHEVPQPSRTNYNSTGAAAGYGYTNGVLLGNSGHLRVTVTPINATVAYVRAFLPADEGSGKTNGMVSDTYTIAVSASSNAPFSGTIVLGRPTGTAITANVIADAGMEAYIEYGTQSGLYPNATPATSLAAGQPAEVVLSSLLPNTRYYYRLRFKNAGDATYLADVEHTFHTQRAPGSAFTFEIQGDSHPERPQQFTNTLYANTLLLAAADQPDFYLCIGDDFSVDHIPTNSVNADLVAQQYIFQRSYLGLVASSAPLFLVNGNHEQAAEYLLDGTSNNVAVWAGNARNLYYPEPAPDGFYTGDTNAVPFVGLSRDYYAWTWGDALFVTLDPYWHCPLPVDNVYGGAAKRTNMWDVTHGDPQYQWLKATLEQSTAKYKFVFAHHVLGTGRGGTEEAELYEWGGQNANGTWGFATNRPAWDLPIHQLMASNRVTAFFQGHDHLFARQQLDGVTYQTLPEPADPNYALYNDDAYDSIYETNNTGRVRVSVLPDRVRIEYVRSYLPADEGPGKTNNMVDYSYDIFPVTTHAWSMAKLPDTGQTNSFTATFGEDSDYTINPPFFSDNGDGTVLDNVTGLTWQKADGGEMTWSNALVYAQTNRVGGRSDWRLPTSHEAFSILNHGTVNPALDTNVFTLSAAQYWWTADALVTDSSRIWSVNAGGGIGPHPMTETISAGGTRRFHVRCVRGAPLSGQPVHHFTNNLDATVTDLDTGLTWQQTEVTPAMNWEAALQYAKGLVLGGCSDWRLPNIKEIQSINDEALSNPSLDTNYFAGAHSARYWSSTTLDNQTNSAWWVDFQYGLVSYDAKATNLYVRCVRGGGTSGGQPFFPQFANIPAGQYQMGDHFGFVDPVHPSDEIPLHDVCVDSFSMATTLLTCREYCDFLNAGVAQGLVEVRSNYVYGVSGTNLYCDTYASDTNSRIHWTGSAFTVRDNRDMHPITGIRWFGAIAYCNWASARDGYTPCYSLATGDCDLTKNGYRLPTEAEWEYAARGGMYSPYGMFPWGSDTNADGTLANWAGTTNPYTTGPYPWTTPVGFYNGQLHTKAEFGWPGTNETYQTRNNANGFGLYDMSGNVWEWVNDWYATDYYTNCVLGNIVTNPPGPLTGSPMPDGKPYRGLRGGNWFNGQDQYGHGRVSNRDPSYYRGPGDPNGPWFHVGFRIMRRGYVSETNQPPVIANVAIVPASPTSNDTVWVTARITDDVSLGSAMLTYSTGGGNSTTTTVFTETMGTTTNKPWTGAGTVNAWTVTGNYLEQRTGSNYGTGNPCGMEYKGGATLNALASAMLTTTAAINTTGTSGYVEFWLQSLTLDGTDGWTFQLDAGSGYVTRLSELSGNNHAWQKYHYDLAAGELVSGLNMRFQFTGGGAADDDRIDLDQITVTVVSAGSSSTTVPMLDDGTHQDGAAGDGTFGAAIPAQPLGTIVGYYLTAADGAGLAVTNPPGAPGTVFSYTVQAVSSNPNQTVGLFLNTTNAWPGYTLIAPMHYTNTYLINNAGEVVHRWTSAYEPGRSAYLLTNGHLFRACMIKNGGPSTGGGEGGRIEEYQWDGNMVWAFDYYSANYIAHHDFKVLPNGNVLVLAAEKKTYAEVIAAGFDATLLDPNIASQGYLLPDYLIEVTPTRPYGGTVVWEWHLWDHMIQDFDSAKTNYGVVADHPELIDVNGPGIKIPQFWNHVNGIDYNPDLDQVMLSIRGNSELFVIDHSNTTAQAASHAGGRYNKGGDILYRWGNPQQYNRGTPASQQLFQQHHTHWIEAGCPGAGHILIFNNGIGRGYSTINEIVPPMDAAGVYSIASGAAYGPSAPAWTYTSSPPTNFYSAEISGCQRLPNGNTLICEGIKGNLFEVTSVGQTVWRYLCPIASEIMTQGDSIPVDPARTDQFMNAVFRVTRYATDYAGLAGHDLTPQGTLELPVDQTLRMATMTAIPSGVEFNWVSLPTRDYMVQYKATLSAASWTNIGTISSIGTLPTFTDTNSARLSQPQGFYRVMLSP